MLYTSPAWTAAFKNDRSSAWHVVRFSLSGIPKEDLGWTPRQEIRDDRWHYDIHVHRRLEQGMHKVEFELRNEGKEERAWLL
jgi:hypothetical protein